MNTSADSVKTVVHVINSLGVGGAEGAMYRLCVQDDTCRHVVICLTDFGPHGPRLENYGIRVVALDMPRGSITAGGLRRLYRLLKDIKPDAIQTWMYHSDLLGGLLGRFAGTRNIAWGIRHTELVRGESSGMTIRIAKICALLSSRVPARIVCCGERAREVHAKLGYDASRMVVIPNGYDMSAMAPAEDVRLALRDELQLDPDQPVFGCIARLNPQKDHPNLLHALARLRRMGHRPTCLLVGEGLVESNPLIADAIEKSGLPADQLRLLGRRSDVARLMNAIDIHVLPSSHGEGFPNVIAEAMACGTPCIATDVGDAARIVGDTGWVVSPRDPEQLASAMRDALIDLQGPAWQNRRAAARRHVQESFSIERMVENYHRAWFAPST